MTPEELKTRIKNFSYRCVQVAEALPEGKKATKIISYQLIRSSFSASINYRAATRAQSKPHFLSKLNIVLEEIDETVGWLESVADLNLLAAEKLAGLHDEGLQLTKILAAAKHTLQLRLGKKTPKDKINPSSGPKRQEDDLPS